MVFLSVCTALYDYAPRTDGELAIREGDLVYILEKSDEDDWWKAKKRAQSGEEEEPTGLIPSNYVEDARPSHHAKALFEYSRQTDEEISFREDASIVVFDTSDPDWTLVGLDGEFGFAPANYIELIDGGEDHSAAPEIASPALPVRATASEASEDERRDPAANLANIISRQAHPQIDPHAPQFTPDASEDDGPGPSLPQRPVSQEPPSMATIERPQQMPSTHGILASPPLNRAMRDRGDSNTSSPGGYHLYNVNEMVSVMGKQKKMPTTLGINLATGVILIIPEKKRDGPQQEWSADKLMHYSIEGKHVFMELVKPSRSIDFHAGAKDTASEIVRSLGELAGAVRAEGLREVIAAGTGGRTHGRMLYDFMAQGDDEVTVADGDEVVIIDDTQSEEWWKVRRVKNGKEGVVPSSYVEVVKTLAPTMDSPDLPSLTAGRSTVEQNRLEEQRLARESINESNRSAKRQDEHELARSREVGPGLKLPHRASSLVVGHQDDNSSPQKSKRDSRADGRGQASKSKPDASKIRTWTDRSGSFKVDAQFIGLKDSKIHLHKVNGVKIAVPVAKMATADLEYVERATGRSLDEDKPLSDLMKRNSRPPSGKATSPAQAGNVQAPEKPEYDWFDFFLKCGVSPYQCERYSYNFNKDSMDESVLPDITANVLRNLGLKEGDVLRVMKYLDSKYARGGPKPKGRNVSFAGDETVGSEEALDNETSPGGLFSGPGGALRNNTRKGRPAPAVQTNDTIDAKALLHAGSGNEPKPPPKDRTASPILPGPLPPRKDNEGFDDDAWDVKPQKILQTGPAPAQRPAPTSSPPPLTGGMADLSLLSQPLQPIVTHTTGSQLPSHAQTFTQESTKQSAHPDSQQQQSFSNQQQTVQPQGASPQFFSQLATPQVNSTQPQPNDLGQGLAQFSIQPTGQNPAASSSRQRPQAPPMLQQNGLMPPPPSRPLSAPQNASLQGNFGPPSIQPQLTGVPGVTNLPQTTGAQPNGMPGSLFPQLGHQPQVLTGYQTRDQFPSTPGSLASFGQNQQMQPHITGASTTFGMGNQPANSPFGTNQLYPQMTGYQTGFNYSNGALVGGQGTSVSSILPTPILPTQLQQQPMASNTFAGNGPSNGLFANSSLPQHYSAQSPPPIPPIPQQPTMAPLQPQKTGPAPAVRFGVAPDTKKLLAQPTGRKANLAQATPENPFGF